MPTYLRVRMPDRSVWEVPAEPIARDRAHAYAESDTGASAGEEYEQVYADELAYTLATPRELIDWAENNLNWRDVRERAVQVEPPEVDYQAGWVNGDKEVVERD